MTEDTNAQPFRGATLLAVVIAVFVVALAVVFYGQAGQDDIYITYFPAWTLATHGRILNYDGIALEQSSSLSLVVTLAALYRLTPFSVPTLGWLVSLGSGIASLLLTCRLARRMGMSSRAEIVLAAGTVHCFGYWTTSGMETSFYAALALWFVDELIREPRARKARDFGLVALAGAGLYGARPEAPLILVGLVCIRAIQLVLSLRFGAVRRSLRDLVGPAMRIGAGLLGGGAVLTFRLAWFHQLLPNPARIKQGGFDLKGGAEYVYGAFTEEGFVPLALLLAGAGALAIRRFRRRELEGGELVLSLAVAQLGFAVLSGGDWMGHARFIAPAIVAMTFVGFAGFDSFLPKAGGRFALALVVALSNFGSTVQMLHRGLSDGQVLWSMGGVYRRFRAKVGLKDFSPVEVLNKIHRRDAITSSELIQILDKIVPANAGRPVRLMSGQAGMIAYHAFILHFGKLRLTDLWSLTSRELYECFPKGSVTAGRWGTWIGTARPLEQHQWILNHCGIPLPDVIFGEGLEGHMPGFFDSLGYDLVYQQTGSVKNFPRENFFQQSTGADGYIAVKHELAEKAGIRKLPTYRYNLHP